MLGQGHARAGTNAPAVDHGDNLRKVAAQDKTESAAISRGAPRLDLGIVPERPLAPSVRTTRPTADREGFCGMEPRYRMQIKIVSTTDMETENATSL